ncbi:hypothetical protein [Roseateles sp.]|uniref:hypothetical protein n=1 Tax=Roseateles sp. TaxID=1971397 RepID=UPI002DFBF8F7|nr:hypothetical protein [Roseateles sp.]
MSSVSNSPDKFKFLWNYSYSNRNDTYSSDKSANSSSDGHGLGALFGHGDKSQGHRKGHLTFSFGNRTSPVA